MWYLSIDPGIAGTGYAVWAADTWGTGAPPAYTGNVYASRSRRMDWQTRAYHVVTDLFAAVRRHGVVLGTVAAVWVEWPEYQEGARGQAAMQKGDILKLCYLIGLLGAECTFRHIPLHLMPVSEWKGQLPKELVERRIQERLGVATVAYASHTWDAVGIGLYAQGIQI